MTATTIDLSFFSFLFLFLFVPRLLHPHTILSSTHFFLHFIGSSLDIARLVMCFLR